MTTPLQ